MIDGAHRGSVVTVRGGPRSRPSELTCGVGLTEAAIGATTVRFAKARAILRCSKTRMLNPGKPG
jgi:hypothetical protein